jgi:hypothetical protein
MKRPSEETWLKIKTDYEFGGKSIRQIAGDYNISDTAIRYRIKQDNWTQKLRAQVIEIQRNIAEISQNTSREQLPYVEAKLNDILDLRKKLNTFIAVAMEDNLKDLLEVRNEPDLINRVNLRARMRANMLDLKELVNTEKVQALDVEEEKDNEIVFRLE